MALSDNIQGRQYDSYTLTSDGTAIRTVIAPDDLGAGLVYATSSSQVTDTQQVLIEKQTLNGRGGSWFVFNSGSTDITVNMYSAYESGAANWSAVEPGSKVWDVVGSNQVIAAGDTKHIPFNNVYRYVALTAYTATSTSDGVVAYLYALN